MAVSSAKAKGRNIPEIPVYGNKVKCHHMSNSILF
jgi:hypothetical protein